MPSSTWSHWRHLRANNLKPWKDHADQLAPGRQPGALKLKRTRIQPMIDSFAEVVAQQKD